MLPDDNGQLDAFDDLLEENDLDDVVDDNDEPDAGDLTDVDEPEQKANGRQKDNDADEEPAPKTTQVQDNRNQQQERRTQQEQPQLFMRPDGTATDAKGNIVDPKSGAIIATAGQGRRHYEKAVRMESIAQDLEQRNIELATKIKAYEVYDNIQRDYRITREELSQSLGIVAEFKTNPVSAARKVVELALAQGYNVSDILGKDAGDAIELRGINQMIEQKLRPFQDLHQQQVQQREQAQRETAAKQALQTFFNEHEYADVHADDLNTLVGNNSSLSPEKAYYELKLFAQQYGLDFSRPLKPQLAALQQQQSAPNRQQARPSQRPLPNGSRTQTGYRDMGEKNFASPTDDWGSIIRSSMR